MKTDRIHHWQTCTTRNALKKCLVLREMTPMETDLQEVMENNGNDKIWSK